MDKFQLAMQVINEELETERDLLETCLTMLVYAYEDGKDDDIKHWLAALMEHAAMVKAICNLKFMVTHPDIYKQ